MKEENEKNTLLHSSSMTFWAEDPCALFTSPSVFPTPEMTRDEKLNSVTRLSIIISLVMYAMGYDQWLAFLLIALLVIVLLYCSGKRTKEGFAVVPTYQSNDFQQTIVSPTFAEEWHIPPPAYDLMTNVPDLSDTFEQPPMPQSYPYGQYLTRTNLLPHDEYYVHLGCGGAKSAREFVNSTFLRHDLAFRDNMSRIYKKKLNRRFRHNCNDTFSPFQGF